MQAPAQSWFDLLAAQSEEMRADLREIDPREVAYRSGAVCLPATDQSAALELRLWDRRYRVQWPEVQVTDAQTGVPCRADVESLILHYLHTADGTPIQGKWLSFHELPDGMFYVQAFQGYTGRRLSMSFGNDLTSLEKAARSLEGFRLDLGDLAFSFRVLPRLDMAFVYWLGDEEMLANATVLFDAAAPYYLPPAGLAVLGSQLVSRLIKSR